MKTGVHKFLSKIYWREILAILMLLLAVMFFRSERRELSLIVPHIRQANGWWLSAAALVTALCLLLEGAMYRFSFAAIRLSLPWADAVVLFLKRNFISIFLPAGGVSSLAYSPSQVRKAGFSKVQVHQASALFGFAGLLTVFIAGLPVVAYTFFANKQFNTSWLGLLALLALLTGIFLLVRSLSRRGIVYSWLNKLAPSLMPSISELFDAQVSRSRFSAVVASSTGVEICGMLHVWLAMLALNFPVSFAAAASAYVISVLMMVISPFLRGLGAVELSLVFVLEQFGYTTVQALSITVLYRVFEFWLPLALGLLAFAWKGRNIFLRLAPALLTFALGAVNIVSVITPPLHYRLRLLHAYLPLEAIHASNMLVLLAGVTLVVTAAFLFRGLRNAWLIAVVLSVVSIAGNLGKALDYEEAGLATVTLLVLVSTASQYPLPAGKKWMQLGIKTALLGFVAVLIFGFVSFYYIDVKHFGIDFTWQQSLVHTLKVFLLVEDTSLQPVTRFGHEFLWFIRILGFITWSFLLFTLIQPARGQHITSETARGRALQLVGAFGNSANDYFKTYTDKRYFFPEQYEAFIAYKTAGGFAVALEGPVCADENKRGVIAAFEQHCRKLGLKPTFYRVNENDLEWFSDAGMRKLMIGQEAILEINTFSLEGKDRKSLRNGLSGLQKKGYTTIVHPAPQAPDLLAALKSVSDDWLHNTGLKEEAFSQGAFNAEEISLHDVIALHDSAGQIQAFLNIIPDYAEDECTYDLIRKTAAAPPAAMDAMIVQLIAYAREKQLLFLNLGMAPMTGIEQPDNTAEQLIKLAAANIKRFQHFKGLREFKEKYATIWENVYLLYDTEFDLLQLPFALKNVMKL